MFIPTSGTISFGHELFSRDSNPYVMAHLSLDNGKEQDIRFPIQTLPIFASGVGLVNGELVRPVNMPEFLEVLSTPYEEETPPPPQYRSAILTTITALSLLIVSSPFFLGESA
ncbi:MAG: hypothetical protein SP1CHLAM54_07940 [Chlamydiia bacterium]|nr:hypothetical protein [Chlamydiia bacterium]MCH9615700.1 hypothetical protein [Chlamydiia bacterium]MCH9628897.1 hypothetical protein [Chlamydiia bacterium]